MEAAQPYFPDLRGHDDAPEGWRGGELDVEWVLAAYRRGFFPWFGEDEPLTWWSSRLRMVIVPRDLYVSRSLARTLRRDRFQVTFDEDFEAVIDRCASKRGPGREGTWIVPELRGIFADLHAAGLAHSVECWQDGRLAGGIYGLSLGGCFFGESMFHDVRDASKIALVTLAGRLAAWDFDFIDCQVPSPHLDRLGGRILPRSRFLELLDASLARDDRRGSWSLSGAAPHSPAT